MASAYIYAGVEPKVREALRTGLLLRGLQEPRQVARLEDLSGRVLKGARQVFVDGPYLRLQRLFAQLDAQGAALPVVWIARASDKVRADAALLARTAAVWDWPLLLMSWELPDEGLIEYVPETPVLAPSGVGELEGERLGYLEASDYETGGPTPRLQRLADWVTRYFEFPIAFVNIIGRELQTAKVQSGLPEGVSVDMPREMSMCQYVVAGQQPLVVPDIPASDFFRENGVAAMVGMQAYAGVPLKNEHDMVMGSLCMVDMAPHPVTLSQMDVLLALAEAATGFLDDGRDVGGGFRLSAGLFHRLGQAVLTDARHTGRPLSVARLPYEALHAPWDEGLAFVAMTSSWGCLACLPAMGATAARAWLTTRLAGWGIAPAIAVVEAGREQGWRDVIARATLPTIA